MPYQSQDEPAADPCLEIGVSEEILSRALSNLALGSDATRATAAAELRKIAENYQLDRWLPLSGRSAAAERKAVRKAALHLEKAIVELSGLAPLYSAALEAIAGGLGETTSPVIADIERAYLAASKFVDMFKPVYGRMPDLALGEAVQAMFDLAKDLEIDAPSVQMNKPTDLRPELNSSSAFAAAVLLRGVNPKLTEIALINMIEDVRIHPNKDDNRRRLISLQSALDLSLHPRRNDPQARRDFFFDEWEEARERARERTRKSNENG
jgi:hypothetical protein